MAINFNDYVEQNEKREAEKANKSVDESVKRNYFSLDDGEKKVVVINFDPASEKIQPVHSYYSNSDGRYTKIKCLGKGCPLCAKANSYGKDEKNYFKSWASPRVFLQIFDEDGTEYVWERPFKFEDVGEILFKDDYLSGILAMDLSSYYTKGCYVSLDLVSEKSFEQLRDYFTKHKEKGRTEEEILLGMFPKMLVTEIMKRGKDIIGACKNLTFSDRKSVV